MLDRFVRGWVKVMENDRFDLDRAGKLAAAGERAYASTHGASASVSCLASAPRSC